MKNETRAFIALLAVIILILIALGLLKKRIGQTSVNITTGDSGQDVMQNCEYTDGTILTQPVRWGPCPPLYRGVPLKVTPIFSAIPGTLS